MWLIHCTVTRGVTCTRSGFLKDERGTIEWFTYRLDADERAATLNRSMNRPGACANFSYEVVDAESALHPATHTRS